MSINPFDEIALEEALRLRESGNADDVVVTSVGTASIEQQLRTGLAMGADRAVLVEATDDLEPFAIAQILHALAVKEQPHLILMGKQSIDGDNNQTGQMLAALWDRPQACFASRIEIDGGRAEVDREVDAGIETLEIELPAVVTTDLRLNEPRYVRLPDILKAKKKPIERIPVLELYPQFSSERQFRVLETTAPPSRPPGKRVSTVTELVAELDQRGLLPT